MRMLVSVRDVAEAQEALRAGVDFIDLKEPAAGARVRRYVGGHTAGRRRAGSHQR